MNLRNKEEEIRLNEIVKYKLPKLKIEEDLYKNFQKLYFNQK